MCLTYIDTIIIRISVCVELKRLVSIHSNSRFFHGSPLQKVCSGDFILGHHPLN